MLHTKYQGSRPYDFRQYFFNVFLILTYVKHVTPGTGSLFSHRGII